MPYQINYTDEARRALRTVPGNYRQRIRGVIEALANNPYPPKSKELRELPGHYRLRVDSWRIIYSLDNQELTILILRVRHKEGPETYQDIE